MGEFERELRAQIDLTRRDLEAAQEAGDHPTVRSLAPRLHYLLQIAVDHDVEIPDAGRPAVVTDRDGE